MTLRSLRRRPLFAGLVVVSLALGIGVNLVVSSVVHATLVRPLPYEDDEALFQIMLTRDGVTRWEWNAYPDIADWREELSLVDGLAFWRSTAATLTASGMEPRRLTAVGVGEGFFETLGVAASLGRTLVREDYRSHDSDAVVLSYATWRDLFGADPEVIGRTFVLDGVTRHVVGVGPERLAAELPSVGAFDLLTPLSFAGLPPDSLPPRGLQVYDVVARLAPGIGLGAAQAELDATMVRLAEEHPETNRGRGARMIPLRAHVVGDVRANLILLMSAVAGVFLIAVVNLANLFFQRASERTTEAAVRHALGASRAKLVIWSASEGLLLAFIGGVLGAAMAIWGTSLIARGAAGVFPMADLVRVDPWFVVLAVVSATAIGGMLGLVPHLLLAHSGRGSGVLSVRGGTSSVAVRRLREGMVVGQLGLSFALLVGAGLLVRTYLALDAFKSGFDTSMTTFRVETPAARYPTGADHLAFHERLDAVLEALSGVEAVASTNGLPFTDVATCGGLADADDPDRFGNAPPCAQVRSVTSDYFEVMGIPLLNGRAPSPDDDLRSESVVVIGRTTAELLWPGQSALGRRILTGFGPRAFTVVGVVADVVQHSPSEGTVYQTYVPFRQWPVPSRDYIVRHGSEAAALYPSISSAVHDLDPSLAVEHLAEVERLRREAIAGERLRATVVGTLGVVAFVLALVGLYGAVAYNVALRRRELAVRSVLGSRPGQIVGLVLRQATRVTAFGLLLGAGGSWIVVRSVASLVFGVPPTDPVTFGALLLTFGVGAAAATVVPARRAAATDPASVLREG